MSGPIFSEDLVGTVRGGNVRVGLFSRWELSGRELPGGKLTFLRSCPGGTVWGKTFRINLLVTVHIYECLLAVSLQVKGYSLLERIVVPPVGV